MRHIAILGLLGLLGSADAALAAEWVQVSQISQNIREVDKTSIQGARPVLTFTSRHVIDDAAEFKVGRNSVKYLVMQQRVDCAKRTTAMLSTEAQRADMSTISKQKLMAQEDAPVLKDSVDEDVLKFVCGGEKNSSGSRAE
ncbi:MAG: surface-adhesin E family protein [Sulfuricellaceae bacterium]